MSVLEMVERILAASGKTWLVPKILNEATAEIPAQHLDWSKAKRVLGWQPRYALEQALGETVEWYRGWLGRVEG
jgi:nucleoside-diphosphate-sugar epimerase